MKYSLIRSSALLVFVVAGLGLATSRSTASELAQSADGFVDTIGVNTHLKFTSGSGNPYGNAQVLTLLGQLGIRNIRDDMPVGSSLYSRLTSLYNTNGIRVCWCPYTWDRTAPSTSGIVTTLKTNAFDRYLEGPNEPDINVRAGYVNYFYNGYTNNSTNNIYVATQAWQTNIYAAVKADSVASNTPVTSAAMGFSINAQYMNPIPLDYEAMHSYPGGNIPTYNLDGYNIANANLMTALPQPLLATETGYFTAINDTNVAADGLAISLRAQAKYLPRLFAEYFNRGIVNTYIYEFMNEFSDPTFTNKEANFGIVNYNFSPNSAFTNLQNLITLLKEASWNTSSKTWSVLGFTPSALGYTLSGSTNNVNHTLLQKSTGEFYLLLWQDASTYYNGGGGGNIANWKDITNASVAVTLTLTTPITNAATYLLGSLTPTATYTNPGSMSLSVTDEVMVVRLMPSQPSAAFSGSPASGLMPLTVAFTNSLTGSTTNWLWIFGDGSTTNTTTPNVSHIYTNAATYTVSLVISGSNGSSTNTLTNYIAAVTSPPSPLLARWTFSTGTTNDLTSDTGGYTFRTVGGTPTYNVGSISLDRFTALLATNINCKTLPTLSNTATVWVKMRFDVTNNANPAFLFGLMNTNTQTGGDYPTVAMVGMNANYGSGFRLGQQSLTDIGGSYATIFASAPTPATNIYFTMACVLQTGYDQNGYPNAGLTEFQTYVNGALVGSGSATGSNVLSQAFGLGKLKNGGGQACTFDDARVYGQALTANQIAQLEWPTANPDTATTAWNVPVTVSPLANDTAPNSYPLTVLSVSGTNATASIIGSTNVLITPTLGIAGTVYVAYTITNSNGGSASSLITITLTNPPNPTANPDTAATTKNATATVQPLNNDSDPNSYPLTVVSVSPTNATASIIGSTNVLVTPTTGFLGTAYVAYSISNGHGGSASSLITVTVTSLPPVANPDSATTAWNAPVMVRPLTNDTDPYSYPLMVIGVSPTNATASIIGGTNVLVTPTLGSAGTAYVAYTITNGNSGTASSLITVTVTTPPKPVVTMVARSGSALVWSGTNGAANGIYQVLSSTNVALPVVSWTPILTNTFDAGGGFHVTNSIDPASPVKFLLIKQ